MAKRLILTRHAKSSWDFSGPDHERPLNPRGYLAAPKIGQWMRDHSYLPDQILSSSARRTVETCEGLGFDIEVNFLKTLYHASARTILETLQSATGDTVLMVGHNPGYADFAQKIVKAPPAHDRFYDYPTCATTVVDFAISNWDELGFGLGHCVDFIVPRDISDATERGALT
ncbi:MAG: SixA phosphatase family protein [Cognatishimia sp.]